jgi:hypothetical protein
MRTHGNDERVRVAAFADGLEWQLVCYFARAQ